jgi:heme-degrading monooxygenase HmoA
MAQVGQPYTSGVWTVRDGSQDEFVARWTKFVRTAAESPGAEDFILVQDRSDLRQFVSFGAWHDWDSVDAWRSSTVFAAHMGACRDLCDDFRPGDSTLRARVP